MGIHGAWSAHQSREAAGQYNLPAMSRRLRRLAKTRADVIEMNEAKHLQRVQLAFDRDLVRHGIVLESE